MHSEPRLLPYRSRSVRLDTQRRLAIERSRTIAAPRRTFFLSYAREHRKVAEDLERDMEAAGIQVWFDEHLKSGREWWDEILERIRGCDGFLFLVTKESIESEACEKERRYARDLDKPILPIQADEVSTALLPADVRRVQMQDYRDRDKDAALGLVKAIEGLPGAQPLPDPLPDAPEIPLGRVAALSTKIRSPERMPRDRQEVIVAELRRLLREPESAEDARKLLEKMLKRDDVVREVGEDIERLLAGAAQMQTRTSSSGEPGQLKASEEPRPGTPLRNSLLVGGFCGLIFFWSWYFTDYATIVSWIVAPLGVAFIVSFFVISDLKKVPAQGVLVLLGVLLGAMGLVFRGTVELDNSEGSEEQQVRLTVSDAVRPSESVLKPGEKRRFNFFMRDSVTVKLQGLPEHEVRLGTLVREQLKIPHSFRQRPVVLIKPTKELAELASTKDCKLEIFVDGTKEDSTETGYDGACCWIGCRSDVRVPVERRSEFESRSFIALLAEERLSLGKVMEVRITLADESDQLAVASFTVSEANPDPKKWPQVIDLRKQQP